ncbi:hypothetical protein KAR91_56335 [Candidatus Pacearchaeota archaeon]|nr:hypothetical protein [Candidatus Pacearchaeota archaeon]
MKPDNVSLKELETFLSTRKKDAERVLSVLGKTQGFYEAINTPVGIELLKDATTRMEIILEKMINEEADETERAEFRALRGISIRWMGKISRYNESIDKIKRK